MKIILIILCAYSQLSFCQTQTEMNLSSINQFELSDSIIKSLVTKIESKREKDTLFISNLRKSQIAWLYWRNIEIETYFPKYKDEVKGTMYAWCYYNQLLEWNNLRIIQLNEYLLDESFFDDGCSPGSW